MIELYFKVFQVLNSSGRQKHNCPGAIRAKETERSDFKGTTSTTSLSCYSYSVQTPLTGRWFCHLSQLWAAHTLFFYRDNYFLDLLKDLTLRQVFNFKFFLSYKSSLNTRISEVEQVTSWNLPWWPHWYMHITSWFCFDPLYLSYAQSVCVSKHLTVSRKGWFPVSCRVLIQPLWPWDYLEGILL